jgi:hypothetical protein
MRWAALRLLFLRPSGEDVLLDISNRAKDPRLDAYIRDLLHPRTFRVAQQYVRELKGCKNDVERLQTLQRLVLEPARRFLYRECIDWDGHLAAWPGMHFTDHFWQRFDERYCRPNAHALATRYNGDKRAVLESALGETPMLWHLAQAELKLLGLPEEPRYATDDEMALLRIARPSGFVLLTPVGAIITEADAGIPRSYTAVTFIE